MGKLLASSSSSGAPGAPRVFWGAEGAPILFSDLGLRMASCSCIYIYTPLPWQPRENISRKQASRDITGAKKHIYAQGRLNSVISQPKYGRCER